MSQPAAIRTRHAEIIDKLGEFYTLLGQLCAVDADLVHLPTVDAPAPIARDAALAAGFTKEAVDLMAQLPYVEVDISADEPEILYSTVPVSLPAYEDEGDFESLRSMDDDPDNEENLIPGTVIKLTSQNIYGTTLLYDTEKCKLIEWVSFNNPDDTTGYSHVLAKPPAEVLDPWIEKYRTFRYMITPNRSLLGNKEDDLREPASAPSHYTERERRFWRASRNLVQALWKIETLYLQCGWDIHSKMQSGFDQERFLVMRTQYMDEVVRPLQEAEEASHQ